MAAYGLDQRTGWLVQVVEVYTAAEPVLRMYAHAADMAAGQRLIAYERVSMARQCVSGLGLEVQRKVIEDFAASHSAEVLARFTEVENGRMADRPEL